MNTADHCNTFFAPFAQGLREKADGTHLGSSTSSSGDNMRQHMCIKNFTGAVNLCLDKDWAMPFMHSIVLVMLERRNPGAVTRCKLGQDAVRNELQGLLIAGKGIGEACCRELHTLCVSVGGDVLLLTQSYGVDPEAMCHHSFMPSRGAAFNNDLLEATGFKYR